MTRNHAYCSSFSLYKFDCSSKRGICDQLRNISKPTLVITGTDDFLPAVNSFIARKIPGAWIVQIRNAGHELMYQYPQTR
jgi:pimeloyl-ACP methyl ester carboxylesterase